MAAPVHSLLHFLMSEIGQIDKTQSPLSPSRTEKYLFRDFFPVVKTAFRMASEDSVRPEYRLVRLKSETVQDLNRLKDETGQASLNNLITKMIQLTDAYRSNLKESGWEGSSDRG